MAISALIVPVPELEPLVADLRLRFDETASLGVPPHVTVLVSFVAPELLTARVIARIDEALSRSPRFAYALVEACRWPEVL